MLFEPFSFSGLSLKNRLVRSATYERRADEDGFVTESIMEIYEELARGGIGLMITGNALVHPSGRTITQMLCIHSDIYVQGLRKLTAAVHELGGLIAIQLTHGGRQSFPILLGGSSPIAPSAIYDTSTKVMPRAMTDTEIWEIVDAFGEAARRARIAGFDAVQIHGAHGYLVSEFFSPHTNRRNDYWGGDEERRFHFLEEVYKAIRREVGEDYPVMIKMNADDLLDGGLRVEEAVRIGRKLQEQGIDAIEVSGGMYESSKKTAQPDILTPAEEAYFRTEGGKFKKGLNIPVMLVGGMRSKAVMEDVLQRGEADLISLSRPLIREPDLPNKFREGKEASDCISCNGCMKFEKLDVVECVQLL
ncbi:MAG TPA: NADH:flavin oxidoreductase [Thermodesulfovibrionales bacterium]|nr:NADH:flavin oxidoreductase [Thermodesulfovibrionales bacterium]